LRALREVATPALVIAEAAVQENLDRTLALTGSSDRWRPHLKTARSVWAAKVLLARGVRRCKVSTPSELRMAVEAGFRDVLLAYPAVGPLQWAVADLAAAHPESRISVLVDSSAALDTWRGRLSAFVDLDTGGHRTGVDVVDEQAVVRLVDDLRARGHRVAGLHSYDGHLADEPAEVRSLEVGRSLRDLAALSRRLAEAGTTVEELVVGSTHTYDLHLAAAAELDGLPHLTVGPGTLLYADIQALERSGGQGHTLAAGVLARVVSTGADTVTVDAGLTAVQVDAGRPHAVVLGHDGLTAGKPSQEHLVLEATTDHLPAVGALLVLVPRHVDTAIAQVGEIHVVAPDGTVHREPVAGRWHRHAG
jgi:D-serine deaminase-like pyridoxal phosphate-dependent protein